MTPHKIAALGFLEALAAVDITTMRSLFTDDVRLHVKPSTREWAGIPAVVAGGDAVSALFAAHHGANDEHAVWRPGTTTWAHEVLVGENDHVVVQTQRHSVTADGADYDNAYVWVFRFVGERIDEIWEHLDTAYAYSVVPRPESTSPAWRGRTLTPPLP